MTKNNFILNLKKKNIFNATFQRSTRKYLCGIEAERRNLLLYSFQKYLKFKNSLHILADHMKSGIAGSQRLEVVVGREDYNQVYASDGCSTVSDTVQYCTILYHTLHSVILDSVLCWWSTCEDVTWNISDMTHYHWSLRETYPSVLNILLGWWGCMKIENDVNVTREWITVGSNKWKLKALKCWRWCARWFLYE